LHGYTSYIYLNIIFEIEWRVVIEMRGKPNGERRGRKVELDEAEGRESQQQLPFEALMYPQQFTQHKIENINK